MNRPEAPIRQKPHKPPVSGNGFTIAAISAPGLAAIAFVAGSLALELSSSGGLNGQGSALINMVFLILLATIWGAIPSLLFGGLVLAVIQRVPWPGRPTVVVFMIGGAVAAGLYVLTALGVAELSPGAALFFAPWAATNFAGGDQGGNTPVDWWVVTSLLLSGAIAGLIYSAFAKKG